ncbi:MAG: histidine kinase, partial [Methanomicrobiales archaeon HGW-Methanomicrobiales-4]
YGDTITRISSSWYQNEEHVVWVFEDNGIGIPETMKDRIFKKGVGHNTGLGLFLIREILDITGIRICETGLEGKGARFEIIIPDGIWQKTGSGTDFN